MSQDQPSWIVAEPTPPPASSRELVLGRPDEATLLRREKAREEETRPASSIPYRVIGLSLLFGAAAATIGTFLATMNPVIDEPTKSAAAKVVDETRTLQGGVPVRKGMNNGVVVKQPTVAPPAPSGEPD